jgi:hypothetical protein
MKKAVKETPYAESDRKPMSPTESISMEETYNGEHSGAGVSFTAFFILCIIAQQFCICKHIIFTDFI